MIYTNLRPTSDDPPEIDWWKILWVAICSGVAIKLWRAERRAREESDGQQS